MSNVRRLSNRAFWALVTDLLILLGDCLVCMWGLVARQPLHWWLPGSMALLTASMLLLLVSAAKARPGYDD